MTPTVRFLYYVSLVSGTSKYSAYMVADDDRQIRDTAATMVPGDVVESIKKERKVVVCVEAK